jgi:hypothetical protein
MLSRAAGSSGMVEETGGSSVYFDSSSWRQQHAMSRATGGNSMVGVEQLEETTCVI